MSETVNQENKPTENVEVQKTFSQEDVNRIVGERLARETAKYADYESLKEKAGKYDEMEEANKTELQKAQEKADKLQTELDGLKKSEEIRQMKEKVSTETGVPVSLITAETEEAAREQAKAIKQYADPGHPEVKDGGEVHNHPSKKSTSEQFSDWLDKNY